MKLLCKTVEVDHKLNLVMLTSSLMHSQTLDVHVKKILTQKAHDSQIHAKLPFRSLEDSDRALEEPVIDALLPLEVHLSLSAPASLRAA